MDDNICWTIYVHRNAERKQKFRSVGIIIENTLFMNVLKIKDKNIHCFVTNGWLVTTHRMGSYNTPDGELQKTGWDQLNPGTAACQLGSRCLVLFYLKELQMFPQFY